MRAGEADSTLQYARFFLVTSLSHENARMRSNLRLGVAPTLERAKDTDIRARLDDHFIANGEPLLRSLCPIAWLVWLQADEGPDEIRHETVWDEAAPCSIYTLADVE